MSSTPFPPAVSSSRSSSSSIAPLTLLAGALIAGVACGASRPPVPFDPDQVHESGGHRFRLVTVADGLDHPWSLAFLPDGGMLVTERSGQLRLIQDGRLADAPVSGVPAVRVGDQGGLLDVVLHPDFTTNQLVYLSYSKPSADEASGTTAVVRGRLDGRALTDVEEIFEADAWAESMAHYGSRLAFDADGFLFVTVGDRQVPPAGDLEAHPAQRLSNHQGTVLRLHADGTVPADNPFVQRPGAKPEIWSYGHRSLQGLLVDPVTGDVWESEHGPQGGDELNLIRPGANYGWPVIGYGVNYGPERRPIHESSSRPGMEQPVRHWVPSIATSGLMRYAGDRFPNWQGNLFLGGMNGTTSLTRLVMDGTAVASEHAMLGTDLRVRDVRANAAGDIFLVLDDRAGAKGLVVRFAPVE